MNSNIENNYEEAFKLLANSDVPKNWYKDEETKTVGLIWHFTDINNMANILSFMKIESKNFAKQNNLVKNDNASKKVNNELTKAWVHDYARFYLHPKTPTQYRNEGIFEKNIDNKNLNLRLLNNNELWMTKPAHLPVPIFICFSLKNFLNRGGYVTTRSLAGGAVSNDVSKMLDKNLKKFKNNIFKIYNDKNSKNYEKQTEFIIKKSLDFEPGDIIKIVVRSNAEKLALLTMLEEHNAQYFSNKEQHQKIDISKYIDKIVVDSSIFFNDAGKLIMLKGHPRGNNIYLKTLMNISPKNYRIESKILAYNKRIDDNIIEHVQIDKLKREIVRVLDINNEEKVVGVFHNPDWILNTQKWRNRRYYSDIYYNYNYLQLWRNVNEDCWYMKNDQPIHLDEKSEQILKQVEESYHVEYRKDVN